MADDRAADGFEFEKLLSWAYRGEVSGETLFDALAEHFAPLGRGPRLRRLAELERSMGAALRPLLDELGITGGDLDRARRDAIAAADEIGRQSYADFLASFEPVTTAALVRYQRLASLGRERDRPVLALLIHHEEALRDFGRSELAGDPDRSLDPVDGVIARLQRRSPGPGA